MAQERVPMSEEMALAFVMGMHERLGGGSQMRCLILRSKPNL